MYRMAELLGNPAHYKTQEELVRLKSITIAIAIRLTTNTMEHRVQK
jgi:hypothetical protein